MTQATISNLSQSREILGLPEALMSVVVLGFVNAEYVRLSREIVRHGAWQSAYETFGISVIVWLALWAALTLLSKEAAIPVSRRDAAVLAASSALFFTPVTALSSVGLTLLSGYFSLWGKTEGIRRSLRIVLALTVTVLWGRLSFSFLLPYILKADAALVSALTGLTRDGNVVLAADGLTRVQIGAGCSSFLNVTTAALGWTTAMIYSRARVDLRRAALLLASGAAIMAINTFRIGLIGWYPQHYALIHGDLGSNVANLASTAAILFFSLAAGKDRR